MRSRRFKAIAVFTLAIGVVLGVILFTSKGLKAADPSGVHVTVYETDLMADQNGTLVTVFTSTTGAYVDIVGNPDVFGKGEVPAATYKRIKFKVGNIVHFNGTDPCGSGNPVSMDFPIDGDPNNTTGQVDLYFASADDGGSSGWFANGSSTSPFLIQNPINVQANATTVVKLIFNTAGTLVCNGSSTAELLPPTMNALNYVQQAPAAGGYCGTLGDYWFFHYRIASYPTDATGTPIVNPTLQQIMSSGNVVSGWGSLVFSAPSTTGSGTWTIDTSLTYENGGMAEHRHNLYQYDTTAGDQGYFDPASSAGGPGGTMTAPYLMTGNKMFMTFPNQFTVEGAFSTDCSTFVGVNLASRDGSDLIVALKKWTGAQAPTIPHNANMVAIGPQVNMSYNATTSVAQYFGYDSAWMALNTGATTSSGIQMEWKNRFEMSPTFSGTGSWTILPRIEQVSMDLAANIIGLFSIRSDGLITSMAGTTPEDFMAIGANGNMIMAGEQTDVSARFAGSHRMAAGYIAHAYPTPSLSDIAGEWVIGTLDTRETTTNWGTGVSYGDMVVTYTSGTTAQACGGFAYRDNFSSQIYPPDSGCSTIELHTECYAWDSTTNTGLSVNTAPASCIIPGTSTPGITMPVFYVKNSTGGVGTKFVLDNNKNVIVLWNPADTDGTPCLTNGGGTCSPDPRDKSSGGVGVKVQ